jgi:hypothetical protein
MTTKNHAKSEVQARAIHLAASSSVGGPQGPLAFVTKRRAAGATLDDVEALRGTYRVIHGSVRVPLAAAEYCGSDGHRLPGKSTTALAAMGDHVELPAGDAARMLEADVVEPTDLRRYDVICEALGAFVASQQAAQKAEHDRAVSGYHPPGDHVEAPAALPEVTRAAALERKLSQHIGSKKSRVNNVWDPPKLHTNAHGKTNTPVSAR